MSDVCDLGGLIGAPVDHSIGGDDQLAQVRSLVFRDDPAGIGELPQTAGSVNDFL